LQMGILENKVRLKSTNARHPMIAPQLALLEIAGIPIDEF
jgi:hypothetical protein